MSHQSIQRTVWIDWLKVIACFMVMTVHSTEPYYLGGDGALIASAGDAFWASLIDSLCRSCVPLFIVASSFLQFPLKYPTSEFLRRRALRILIPLALWSVIYAFYWGDTQNNLRGLLLNFNYASGHLWFVYMIVGLYLIMPLLSAWAEKVSKRELSLYVGLWLLTTLIPLLRDWVSTGLPVIISGATGLPRQAQFPLWGEASWNSYGTFYYISGMVGYLLLGLWFRRFAPKWSGLKTSLTALALFLSGFCITFSGFIARVLQTCKDELPAAGGIETAVYWETTWGFDTIGVALMTIAMILIFRKCNSSGWFYRSVILPISKVSYGVYLGHMIFVAAFSPIFREWISSTPLAILLTAASSFLSATTCATCLRRLPVAGKYLGLLIP